MVQSEPLQWFISTAATAQLSTAVEPGPGPGPEPEPEPGPARHRRRRWPPPVAARARTCGHRFLLIARENSKYPKGTPFVPIFHYLNTSNFHLMVNVGLNAFSLSLIHI